MNNKSSSTLEIIKGLFVLAILVGIIAFAAQHLINATTSSVIQLVQAMSKMDAVIVVALITGAVSIVSVVVSSIIAKVLEYRRSTRRYLYEKREEPYSEFIEMVYKLQQSTKGTLAYPENELLADIIKFSRKLTLWGSDRVIKKWLKFRENGLDANKAAENLFILEDIIFEIRKDMGQRKGKLEKGDLLAFFVNDIRKYTPRKRP